MFPKYENSPGQLYYLKSITCYYFNIPPIENLMRCCQLRFLFCNANGDNETLLRMLITSQSWKDPNNPHAKYSTKIIHVKHGETH